MAWCQRHFKMSIFAEMGCRFLQGSIQVLYSLIHHITCRFEARQALIYQLASGLTGENGKYNYSKAVHLYPPFFDIFCSPKNYKTASALTPGQRFRAGRPSPRRSGRSPPGRLTLPAASGSSPAPAPRRGAGPGSQTHSISHHLHFIARMLMLHPLGGPAVSALDQTVGGDRPAILFHHRFPIPAQV